MTDDGRTRVENWQLYRREWNRHAWVGNSLFRWRTRTVPGPNLTLTVQTSYPERVQATVSGLTVGQTVTVSRYPAGSTTRTTVRGMSAVVATSSSMAKIDDEAPFGILLTYVLTVNGVDVDTETVTLTLAGSKVVLSDAISGDSAEVVVLAWPSKKRERNSSVYAVGGRNIVVSGQRGGFSGTIDIFTETDDSKDNVFDLLQNATSGIIQIRCADPSVYDGVDAYISVLSDDEQRYSQDGSDERRIISLDVVETGAWAPTLESPGFTLDDIKAAYAGRTYADLAADYATLLDISLGTFE